MKFCDICGVEILCDDELGKIDKRNYNIAGKRHTTKTTSCKDCVEEQKQIMKEIANSPEAEIEILHDKILEDKK